MGSSTLDRKLVVSVLFLFLIPTVLAGGILALLYRSGIFADNPTAVVLTGAVGFLTMMVCLGTVTYFIGRSVVRSLREIQRGTELMATVNPDYRLSIRTGDELQSLAEEINRMADHVQDARRGLEHEVAQATQDLDLERKKLSAVLAELDEGVLVLTPEGRATLANRAAREMLGPGLLGRSFFDFVDREKLTHFLDRLREGKGTPERFTLHAASGAILQVGMTPLGDGQGRMTGFILALRDVSRPVHLEQERQRLLTDTLRDLRSPVASIRSLSENLLAHPASDGDVRRPLLEAVHAEALRLSELVKGSRDFRGLGLTGPPWHFDEVTVADLAVLSLRRLQQGTGEMEAVDVEVANPPAPPVKAEISALSGALAYLLRAILARREPGARAWWRPTVCGQVLRIEVGAKGKSPVTDLEGLLDTSVAIGGAGRVSVREIVRQHAGEVWAYADGDRLGFRINLPVADSTPAATPRAADDGNWTGCFVGAGTVSGLDPGQQGSARPDFYDFSLFNEMERHLLPPERERLLDELTYVVFDTETTGLHPEKDDRILSIAGVKVRGGMVKRGEAFDALVYPGRPIPPPSVAFHGITETMVAEAPPIDVVLPAFLRFAEDAVLVGHQVWFDIRFLSMEAERLGLPPPTLTHPVLDTLHLSTVVHGPHPGHGLDAVAKRLGVVVRGRHSALGDALATAEIFVRLVELLRRRGVRTLGQAIDAARCAHDGWGDESAAERGEYRIF